MVCEKKICWVFLYDYVNQVTQLKINTWKLILPTFLKVSYANVYRLWGMGFQEKIFKKMILYTNKTHGDGKFKPKGQNLNNVGTAHLHNATYHISAV